MQQKKLINERTQESLAKKAVVLLGNSSREQLSLEAKQWVKEAQKESKDWGKMFVF